MKSDDEKKLKEFYTEDGVGMLIGAELTEEMAEKFRKRLVDGLDECARKGIHPLNSLIDNALIDEFRLRSARMMSELVNEKAKQYPMAIIVTAMACALSHNSGAFLTGLCQLGDTPKEMIDMLCDTMSRAMRAAYADSMEKLKKHYEQAGQGFRKH